MTNWQVYVKRSMSLVLFSCQTWWWDHDAHRGRPGSGVTGFGSHFSHSLFLCFYFSLLLSPKARSFISIPMSVQIMRSEGQRLMRSSITVKCAAFSFISGVQQPVYLLRGCCQLSLMILISGRFPNSVQDVVSVRTKVTPPACLHIYPEDTACCLISPANCGATSVFFKLI